MVAVPLKLLGTKKTRSGHVWTVQAESGKTVHRTLPRRARPFVLGPAADRVPGLMVQGGGGIMPLDAGLRWVELSGAERAAVLHPARAGTAST